MRGLSPLHSGNILEHTEPQASRCVNHGLVGEQGTQPDERRKTVFCRMSMMVVVRDHHTHSRMTVTNHDHHGHSRYDGRGLRPSYTGWCGTVGGRDHHPPRYWARYGDHEWVCSIRAA